MNDVLNPHRLTADLCARAIVAACRSFGDDPVRAISARTNGRRGLLPAASAIALATGVTRKVASRVIGTCPTSIATAFSKAGHDFAKAETAALVAIGGAALALQPVENHITARRPKSDTRPTPDFKAEVGADRRQHLAAIPISAGPFAPERAAALPALSVAKPYRCNNPVDRVSKGAEPKTGRSPVGLAPPCLVPAAEPVRPVATCAWPMEEGACASPVFKRSYCEHHFGRVYVVGSAKSPKPIRDHSIRSRRIEDDEGVALDGRRA